MLKQCGCCKEERDIKLFSKDKNRLDGLYVYCKPCVKEKSHQRYLKNKDEINKKTKDWKEKNKESYLAQQREYAKGYRQSLNGKYREYKGGATKRNLVFELTKESFAQYWQKPCHYCGDEISTIGVDRIDNNLGYTISNVVPCCEICNLAKRDMTQAQYIEHCKKIANKWS